MTKLKLTPKHIIMAVEVHAGQSRVICNMPELSDAQKILILRQLNVGIEILLRRANCYNGYANQDDKAVNLQILLMNKGVIPYDVLEGNPAYHCHSYITVSRAPKGDLHLQQNLSI